MDTAGGGYRTAGPEAAAEAPAATKNKRNPYFTQPHHTQTKLGMDLVCPQERAHMHDDPERRALAQPRHDVAARAGGSGTSRLAHHTGAHDESHVWLDEVR